MVPPVNRAAACDHRLQRVKTRLQPPMSDHLDPIPWLDVLAHTDTTGTPQANQALSEKRAAAVASYLAGHGVARARIASRGLGESVPLYNPDTTETEKAANRRIEIRLVPYR